MNCLTIFRDFQKSRGPVSQAREEYLALDQQSSYHDVKSRSLPIHDSFIKNSYLHSRLCTKS